MRYLRTVLAMLVIASGAFMVAPAPVGAAPATLCTKTYTVVKNDSWNRIAGRVKVSMGLLLKANKANTRTMLLIGDVICLPKSAITKAQSTGLGLKAPAKRYTAAQSEAIIREIFPDSLENRAIAIVKRESKLNAAAYNKCCVGLFQIHFKAHRSTLARIGITSAQELLDARKNTLAALTIYKRSGWSPWNM